MVVIIRNEDGSHHYTMTDQEWFDDYRGHMAFAFGCSPALASLFLQTKMDLGRL